MRFNRYFGIFTIFHFNGLKNKIKVPNYLFVLVQKYKYISISKIRVLEKSFIKCQIIHIRTQSWESYEPRENGTLKIVQYYYF